MYYKDNFDEEFFGRLYSLLPAEKVNFVRNLIKEDRRDSNLKIMQNDVYTLLEEQGILKEFEAVCNELNIQWTHSNESLV